jgi:hypothetical protein
MSEVCKCCGQTLPKKVNLGIKLCPGHQQMVETIVKAGKHGIRSDRLFDSLYSGPDGGPDTGMKVLHVRISLLNKRLRKAGYEIVGERTGSANPGHYRLMRHVV